MFNILFGLNNFIIKNYVIKTSEANKKSHPIANITMQNEIKF